jgi:hypothetical protein
MIQSSEYAVAAKEHSIDAVVTVPVQSRLRIVLLFVRH